MNFFAWADVDALPVDVGQAKRLDGGWFRGER
jgi:hypothetical protein